MSKEEENKKRIEELETQLKQVLEEQKKVLEPLKKKEGEIRDELAILILKEDNRAAGKWND